MRRERVLTLAIRAISWEVLLFLFCIVPLALIVFYPTMYDGFFIFLVWTSALNSALAGIGIADYFFLRRQRLNLNALHGDQRATSYRFAGGINPIGITALVVGFIVYVVIFNPQTLESIPAFKYLTASLPSCLSAGLVHYVLTRLFARRLGWGEYPNH